MVRASLATSTHSASPAPSPGSRSSTSRSGGMALPWESTRHCGTWISRAAIWASQVRVAGSLTRGYWMVRSLCVMAARGTQPGVEWSRFFWKNISPGASAVPTPWTQRLRVAGRLRAAGISTGATAA
ncbi:hypothetical protein SRABI128_05165 [Microbacterium sp. Bi128]|nr:hypothetical protein SRABI128_05165 [Microbacterium sp. Bi128]